MDSRSHTSVAKCLLDYIEQTQDIVFDRKAFYFGNLKPDLKGEYLSKRHYPSLMFDEVMDKIKRFVANFKLSDCDTRRFAEDLGEICHYITDFFSFPHNDDIYEHNLLAHYIYEKKTSFRIKSHVNEKKFEKLAAKASKSVYSDTEDLIGEIKRKHGIYVKQENHSISDDVRHICSILVTLVSSILNIIREPIVQPLRKPA